MSVFRVPLPRAVSTTVHPPPPVQDTISPGPYRLHIQDLPIAIEMKCEQSFQEPHRLTARPDPTLCFATVYVLYGFAPLAYWPRGLEPSTHWLIT